MKKRGRIIIAFINMIAVLLSLFPVSAEESVDTSAYGPHTGEGQIVYVDVYQNGGFIADLEAYWSALDNMEMIDFLYNNLMAREEEIWVCDLDPELSAEKFQPFFEAVLNLHPDLYFVGTSYTQYITNEGYIESMVPEYIVAPEEQKATQDAIDAEVSKIISGISDGMSGFDKMTVVHDYFMENYSYDYVGLNDNSDMRKFTMAKLFIDKVAVCQGFAFGFKYVLEDKLGIPCTIVQSDDMNHVWNQIQLENDDNWYHIDLTNNNAKSSIVTGTSAEQIQGRTYRTIFLLSDETIKKKSLSSDLYHNYEPDGRANSKKYESLDILSSITRPAWIGGYWYYGAYGGGGSLCRYSSGTGGGETLRTINDDWRRTGDGGATLLAIYSVCAELGGKIYYNTSTQICCYDPASGTHTVIADMPEGVVINDAANSYRCIYNLYVSDGTLHYTIADSEKLVNPADYQLDLEQPPAPPAGELTLGEITMENGGVELYAYNGLNEEKQVRIAYYDGDGRFIGTTSHTAKANYSTKIKGSVPSGAKNISVFIWKNELEPQCSLCGTPLE